LTYDVPFVRRFTLTTSAETENSVGFGIAVCVLAVFLIKATLRQPGGKLRVGEARVCGEPRSRFQKIRYNRIQRTRGGPGVQRFAGAHELFNPEPSATVLAEQMAT
jgi:hypothetical protein